MGASVGNVIGEVEGAVGDVERISVDSAVDEVWSTEVNAEEASFSSAVRNISLLAGVAEGALDKFVIDDIRRFDSCLSVPSFSFSVGNVE